MEFKDRLVELRKAHNMSQAELAKALNLSIGSIGNYESGKRYPKREILEVIADYFNVDFNYLHGQADKSLYILNPEIAEIAKQIESRPELISLLKEAEKSSNENINYAITFLKTLNDGKRR